MMTMMMMMCASDSIIFVSFFLPFYLYTFMCLPCTLQIEWQTVSYRISTLIPKSGEKKKREKEKEKAKETWEKWRKKKIEMIIKILHGNKVESFLCIDSPNKSHTDRKGWKHKRFCWIFHEVPSHTYIASMNDDNFS